MADDEQNRREGEGLGLWLQRTREGRGESLDDVARVTRIGKTYLLAIEEDHLDKLPSPVYAKGFVRLYARHLGVDLEELVSRTEPELLFATGHASDEDKDLPTSRPPWAKALVIPLFLLCLVLLFAFYPTTRNSTKQELDVQNAGPAQHVPPRGQGVSSGKDLSGTTATTIRDKEEPLPNQALAPGIVLRLKAVRDAKLHITIDGTISQEYDLASGDLIEWKAGEVFLLDLDNGASVEGDLNGVALQPLGGAGKPVHLSIRADGVHAK